MAPGELHGAAKLPGCTVARLTGVAALAGLARAFGSPVGALGWSIHVSVGLVRMADGGLVGVQEGPLFAAQTQLMHFVS